MKLRPLHRQSSPFLPNPRMKLVSQSVSHVEVIKNPEFIEGLSSKGTVDFIIGIPLFISFEASSERESLERDET